MIKSLLRGNLVSPSMFMQKLEEYKIPKKKWRRLKFSRQLKRLQSIPHDILIDTSRFNTPTLLLVFTIYHDNETTVLVDAGNIQKIDLGPGIDKNVFNGTVIEVKYVEGTFNVCDVFLFKGELVTDRSDTFEKLNSEFLPFLSRPKVFSYSDIPQISDNKLLFLPKVGQTSQDAWVFVPDVKCGR
jgi:hypothetical protein